MSTPISVIERQRQRDRDARVIHVQTPMMTRLLVEQKRHERRAWLRGLVRHAVAWTRTSEVWAEIWPALALLALALIVCWVRNAF